MVVDAPLNRLPPGLQVELDELCGELADFNGYRSVWLGDGGQVWHAEPDELLEQLGHRYVGTFMRPTAEELGGALTNARPWGSSPKQASTPVASPDYGAATAMPALA